MTPADARQVDWIKEAKGSWRAYRNNKHVAAIQGDGVAGWRYILPEGEWSSKYSTVRLAKTMAQNAIRRLEDQRDAE